MAGYKPMKITGMQTGLVQSREEFILPNDAYPTLENAYVWRERILRKKAFQLLGRLQRNFTASSLGNSGASPWTFNFYTTVVPNINLVREPNATIIAGSVVITIGAIVFTDQGNGTLTSGTAGNSGIIDYITGNITLTHTAGAGVATTVNFSYAPGLPVMGIRLRERTNSTFDETVFFDTTYAYRYNGALGTFEEFLPGTTWTGTDAEFFWSTNYWVDDSNNKIFWATNYSASNDPIRFTNGLAGTNWADFTPQINNAGDKLLQCLALLPYRGRLVAFNTDEGTGPGPGLRFTNRIRWAAIGTPFTTTFAAPFPTISSKNADAWRDDIRGQGGFLDIPTSEDIVSVGFVRDNVIIFCERSTWQLRYTGRTIAPFQIERVNSEIGALGAFSSIQFDTSLLCIGDKGIVECDSYKSELIDVKIPDFVFNLNNTASNSGAKRIQGVRDFINRLAYWTFISDNSNGIYPNSRLVYNYENDSWAIFTDSLTTLGTFLVPSSRNWVNTHIPWIQCNFPWINQPTTIPAIVGGNQQGFIEYLDEQTTNDPSLFITAITGNGATNQTIVITSPNHNLITGTIIKISGIPAGTPFATTLNGKVFGIIVGDLMMSDPTNKFQIGSYNSTLDSFTNNVLSSETGYVGGGLISVRDNFSVTSKKFNFIDEGQSIQMGYLDILMESTETPNPGAISLNVYLDYNDSYASNTLPANAIDGGLLNGQPDTFFNATIPTATSTLNTIGGTKFWQRVYCPTRANFLTLKYTFSNSQMNGIEQTLDVQIDAQVLWLRRGGRLTQI